MSIKKITILKYCVIILSVLNMIWLFGFDYRIPDLKGSSETEETADAASTAEAQVAVEEEKQEEKPEEKKEPEKEMVRCRVTVSTRLNVREGPGTNYKVVTTAEYNEILTVLGVENGWVHVRNEQGQEGYVSELYIEIINE